MKKRNIVVGVLGFSCINCNFNADASGYPNRIFDDYVWSPQSIKYAFRYYWHEIKKKQVFVYRERKNGRFVPQTVLERYEQFFGPVNRKGSSNMSVEALRNGFRFVDTANFGFVFDDDEIRANATGVVQIAYAMNKYQYSKVKVLDTASNDPSTNVNGSQFIRNRKPYIDEGHFFSNFVVIPSANLQYERMLSDFGGYSVENYLDFKEAALHAVTYQQTLNRAGANNEFAFIVEFKEKAFQIPYHLEKFILFQKEIGDSFGVIDLIRIFEYLRNFEEMIDHIEVYFNPETTKLQMGEMLQISITFYSIKDEIMIPRVV